MTQGEMKVRTKRYGLRIIKLVEALSADRIANVIGGQLLRAGTSVGANYRAACRAKSTADFINKLKIVEEECDESLYWMELMVESGLIPATRLAELLKEGDEIVAIVVASIKSSRTEPPVSRFVNRKS
jgi:four helix bundle protein